MRIASQSLVEQAQASFRAYDSLWNARVDQVANLSMVLSKTPQVRAAFGTRDNATIRDVASEAWDTFSRPGTLFVVTDPGGSVIAPAGTTAAVSFSDASFIKAAAKRFPHQARGFVSMGNGLYQIVVTPVYVAAERGEGLLNVLIAGIPVDAGLVNELKTDTGASEFLFSTHGHLVASSLPAAARREVVSRNEVRIGGMKYYAFATTLSDLDGNPVGELQILQSFDAADKRISEMRTRLLALWLAAMLAGLALTYLLARRLIRPVAALDRAAAELAEAIIDAIDAGARVIDLSVALEGSSPAGGRI